MELKYLLVYVCTLSLPPLQLGVWVTKRSIHLCDYTGSRGILARVRAAGGYWPAITQLVMACSPTVCTGNPRETKTPPWVEKRDEQGWFH